MSKLVRMNTGIRYLIVAAVTLLVALAGVQVAGAAATGSNGNGSGGTPEIIATIDALSQQLADVQAQLNGRVDDLQQQVDDQTLALTTNLGDFESLAVGRFDTVDTNAAAAGASANGRFDTVDGSLVSLSSLIDAETGDIDSTLGALQTAVADIHGWANGLANPDPFTTTITTCADYGGGGQLGVEFAGQAEAAFKGRAGVNLFGTGVTAEVTPSGTAAGKIGFGGFGNIYQEVCYAGVLVEGTPENRTANQDQLVLDYTATAYDFQGQGGPVSGAAYAGTGQVPVTLASYGDGQATFASSHSGVSLLDLSGAIGAGVGDMVGALEALAAVDAASADPTLLFSGTAFDDFTSAMGPGIVFDAEDLVAPFLDLCGTIAGLGPEAAAACAGSEEGLAQTIQDIDDAVGVIETGVVAVSDDLNGWLKTTVDGIDTTIDTVDDYMRTTLKGAVDGVRSVVNTIKSWTNTIKGWVDTIYDLVGDAWDCVTLTGVCGNGH